VAIDMTLTQNLSKDIYGLSPSDGKNLNTWQLKTNKSSSGYFSSRNLEEN
jgi:hypothetical protein